MALYRLPFNNTRFPPYPFGWAGSGNWDSPSPTAHGWGQPFAWDITYVSFAGTDDGVYAARAGTVIEAKDGIKGSNDSDGSGNFVLIRHADNTVFAYLHMWHDTIVVTVGDYLAQGDRIGTVGNSGATGGVVHLHMEGNTWHDPKVISDLTDDAYGASMLVHFEDGYHSEPWRPVRGDVFVPNPLHRRQDGWRFCAKCAGLYFKYQGKNGVCPSSGKHQTQMHGGIYTLNLDASGLPGEQGWKYCNKCRVLFFAYQQATSKCPVPSV